MITKEIFIRKASVGLMPRPLVTAFVQKAYEFKSHIWIEKEDNRAEARSLLDMLSLGIHDGDQILLIADGADEQQAADAFSALAESCNTELCLS
ncbi:MAG: HPr family phosphocarrier protein [Oscillospiraceae bacterium]|nr:HPr family phosphocarrier protein [Oscillospiraceae bacterium]